VWFRDATRADCQHQPSFNVPGRRHDRLRGRLSRRVCSRPRPQVRHVGARSVRRRGRSNLRNWTWRPRTFAHRERRSRTPLVGTALRFR
jgi:hypothetical protein